MLHANHKKIASAVSPSTNFIIDVGLSSTLSTAAARAQERAAAAASGGLIGQTMLQELEDLVGDRVEEYDVAGVELRRMEQEHGSQRAELELQQAMQRAELDSQHAMRESQVQSNREAALGEIHRLSSTVSDDSAFARQLHRRLSKQQRPLMKVHDASIARRGRSSSSRSCTLI